MGILLFIIILVNLFVLFKMLNAKEEDNRQVISEEEYTEVLGRYCELIEIAYKVNDKKEAQQIRNDVRIFCQNFRTK